MSRPLRIEFEGAVYHITARGNERQPIFIDDEDRLRFLNILKELTESQQIILYCYCLMTNHYHLLLETPFGNLIRNMHTIQTRYTMYFNSRQRIAGHLFQGRYKSLIVDKDNYLLELSRYIHLNPLRAGIVKRADDYNWSSCKDYLQERVGIVDRDFILSKFGRKKSVAHKRYQVFLNEGIGIEKKDLRDNIFGQLVIGTEQFWEKIQKKIEDIEISEEVPKFEEKRESYSIDFILQTISDHYEVDIQYILSQKRRRNNIRKVTIFFVRKYTDLSLKAIAEYFGGVHYSAISQIVRRIEKRIEEDDSLDEMIKVIQNKLKVKT